MYLRNRTKFNGGLALATAFCILPASAIITAPYTADSYTLHLWHMDEANPGPAIPDGSVSGSFDLAADLGATLGNAAYPGMGTAGSTAATTNSGFKGNSIPVSAVTGANGAFTFEALVNTSSITAVQMIVAMDNNGANSTRPFHFRMESGKLRMVSIGASFGAGNSGSEIIDATIPTAGPDAFVADEWFHVAVTYNGAENTADNVHLYWTRVDPSRLEANLIGTGKAVYDLAGGSAILGIGNDYRTSGSGNTHHILGLVDEVRISGIARAADAMMFAGADADPPLLTGTDPADDATEAPIASSLVATFNEIIVAGTGNIELWKVGTPDTQVESFDVTSSSQLVFNANTVTIDPSSDLVPGEAYYVLIDSTAIKDASTNPFEGISDITAWNFTADGTAPSLTATDPADNEPEVLLSGDLVASFDENVVAGTGSIELWKVGSPDSLVESFDVTSSGQLSIVGSTVTIDPSSDLEAGSEYYVLIPATALEDTSGNAYSGIIDPTAWSFTADGTGPTASGMGPAADATEVIANTGLTLNFGETVVVGSGNITIHLANDDSVVQTIDVTSGAVVVSGSDVTIDLSQLLGSTAYYVNIDAGAFVDLSGNTSPGISDTSTWAFTTAVIPEGVLFYEDFSGDGSDLNGDTPTETTNGALWVAAPAFKQDGSVVAIQGSATLAFTPFHGYVYTLEASLTGVSGDGSWFAMGFANGQSTGTSYNFDRFITGTVIGTAWMLVRGDSSVNPNMAQNGTGVGFNGGTADPVPWTDPTLANSNPGGDFDLRIILDTTGGPGAWTATWYAKRPTDSTYVEVRETTAAAESITSVGLALSNSGLSGNFGSFKLYTGYPVDEPLFLKISQSGGNLDFEWNSLAGMQYDLLSSTDLSSNPETWTPYFDGVNTYENLPATGTNTTLTGVLKSGNRRFFVIREEPFEPVALLMEDFDSGDGGFTVVDHSGGGGTVWAVGDPDSIGLGGSVSTGNGGSAQCWGTDIGNPGFYATGTDTSLISPVIDLTSVPNAVLSFAQAIDILSGDNFVVNIIEADIGSGINVLEAAVHTSSPDPNTSNTDWETVSGVPISGGQPVRIEWRFTGNNDGTYMGAYIDDVSVLTAP